MAVVTKENDNRIYRNQQLGTKSTVCCDPIDSISPGGGGANELQGAFQAKEMVINQISVIYSVWGDH